jgi:hypothetical protein
VATVAGDLYASMTRRLLACMLASLLSSDVLASQSKNSQSRHTLTFTFDYDFRVTPACSPQVKKNCVQKFNFYDISLGIPKKVLLGSLPVPAGAKGLAKGISFTSERRLFNSGKHMVAVEAELESGFGSDLAKCSAIIKTR